MLYLLNLVVLEVTTYTTQMTAAQKPCARLKISFLLVFCLRTTLCRSYVRDQVTSALRN